MASLRNSTDDDGEYVEMRPRRLDDKLQEFTRSEEGSACKAAADDGETMNANKRSKSVERLSSFSVDRRGKKTSPKVGTRNIHLSASHHELARPRVPPRPNEQALTRHKQRLELLATRSVVRLKYVEVDVSRPTGSAAAGGRDGRRGEGKPASASVAAASSISRPQPNKSAARRCSYAVVEIEGSPPTTSSSTSSSDRFPSKHSARKPPASASVAAASSISRPQPNKSAARRCSYAVVEIEGSPPTTSSSTSSSDRFPSKHSARKPQDPEQRRRNTGTSLAVAAYHPRERPRHSNVVRSATRTSSSDVPENYRHSQLRPEAQPLRKHSPQPAAAGTNSLSLSRATSSVTSPTRSRGVSSAALDRGRSVPHVSVNGTDAKMTGTVYQNLAEQSVPRASANFTPGPQQPQALLNGDCNEEPHSARPHSARPLSYSLRTESKAIYENFLPQRPQPPNRKPPTRPPAPSPRPRQRKTPCTSTTSTSATSTPHPSEPEESYVTMAPQDLPHTQTEAAPQQHARPLPSPSNTSSVINRTPVPQAAGPWKGGVVVGGGDRGEKKTSVGEGGGGKKAGVGVADDEEEGGAYSYVDLVKNKHLMVRSNFTAPTSSLEDKDMESPSSSRYMPLNLSATNKPADMYMSPEVVETQRVSAASQLDDGNSGENPALTSGAGGEVDEPIEEHVYMVPGDQVYYDETGMAIPLATTDTYAPLTSVTKLEEAVYAVRMSDSPTSPSHPLPTSPTSLSMSPPPLSTSPPPVSTSPTLLPTGESSSSSLPTEA